jgi:hypothetical protein
MPQYLEETLLILTKTYPSPSQKHRETSCVAAMNNLGEMRRLFPIPFRLLNDTSQFARWEWVRARVIKAADDHRPESYKVDVDSIVRVSKMGTDQGWAERMHWIDRHIVPDFNALEARRQATGETLGLIRPSNIRLEITPSESSDWTDEEKTKLIRDGLFNSPEAKLRVPLQKVPFNFHYLYEQQTTQGTTIHRHKITDWEACALYWNCQRDYGNNWEHYFRLKLEEDFSRNRDLMFLMGTMHRFPDHWLIVGLLYPPKAEARQQLLFP